jgi:hypothetical protein
VSILIIVLPFTTFHDMQTSASASAILSIAYDVPEMTSTNDPLLRRMDEFIGSSMKAASPTALLVDFFPWMKYVPACIAGWKRDAIEGHQKFSKMFEDMLHQVEKRIVRSRPWIALYSFKSYRILE